MTHSSFHLPRLTTIGTPNIELDKDARKKAPAHLSARALERKGLPVRLRSSLVFAAASHRTPYESFFQTLSVV